MQQSTSAGTNGAVAGILISGRPIRQRPTIGSGIDACRTAARWLAAVRDFLRRSIPAGIGAAMASFLAHGMWVGVENLAYVAPISTYGGFWQHVTIAMERLWSHAHGWQSMMVEHPEVPDHAWRFGRAYAQTLHLGCPLIGFALYWIISRHRVGIQAWRPLAIALVLDYRMFFPNPVTPQFEVQRTMLAVLLMVWSVGGWMPLAPFPRIVSESQAA